MILWKGRVVLIGVECNLDEFLVRSLGFSRKRINHAGDKGRVVKKVNNSQILIGMIDEDPYSRQPKDMERYKEKEVRGSVKLLVNRNDPQKHLIQVSPILEEWLYERARINRMSMDEYNLPREPMKLHSFSRKEIERNPGIRRFLNDLIERDQEVQYVKKWIKEALE